MGTILPSNHKGKKKSSENVFLFFCFVFILFRFLLSRDSHHLWISHTGSFGFQVSDPGQGWHYRPPSCPQFSGLFHVMGTVPSFPTSLTDDRSSGFLGSYHMRKSSAVSLLNKYPMDKYSGSLENVVYYSIWWSWQGVLGKDLKGKERGLKKAREMHMDSIQRRTRALQDLVQCGSSLLLTYAKEFGLYPESSTKPWKHWNAGVTGPDLHIRAQFPLILKFSTSIM